MWAFVLGVGFWASSSGLHAEVVVSILWLLGPGIKIEGVWSLGFMG